MATGDKDKVMRLEDLEVKEVSVVDRGANKRSLLVVKNAGELEAEQDAAFQRAVAEAQAGLGDEGESSSDAVVEANKSTPSASTPDPVVAAQAAKAEEDGVLTMAMTDEMKSAMSETLKALGARLTVLSETVAAAKSDPTAMTQPVKLTGELVAVAQALDQLTTTNKSAAIADIAKRGKIEVDLSVLKMGEGGMFMLPVEMAIPFCCEYARKMMYDATDQLYGPDYNPAKAIAIMLKVVKMLAPIVTEAVSVELADDLALFKQYAFNQPQASNPAGVTADKLPEGVNKAGRKMSEANMSKLEGIYQELQSFMQALKPEAAAPVAKNDTDLEAANKKLADQNQQLLELVKKQNVVLKSLQQPTRPVGQGAQHSEQTPPAVKQTTWPDDLNELNADDPDRFD